MALPKINTFPMYSITIPSTQKQVRFRPYNVGEDKVLLIAFESDDRSQIAMAILDIVLNCAEEPLNPNELTVFDIEYLFLQIRAKAVGEKSHMVFTCPSCEQENEVSIPIDSVHINTDNLPDRMIPINDDYTIEMKFPVYKEMVTNAEALNVDNINELVFQLILMSLDKLHGPEELISFKDESKEEIESFVNNLTTDQYEKILAFISKVPKLSHVVEYKCESCSNDNKYRLEGLTDFF